MKSFKARSVTALRIWSSGWILKFIISLLTSIRKAFFS